jgi:hypothetical protein
LFASFDGCLRHWSHHVFERSFSMPFARFASVLCCAGAATLALVFASSSGAQTVWSGLTFNFTRVDNEPAELEENQDRITDSVWITRSEVGQGLLNAFSECDLVFGCQFQYQHNFSPEGTQWATAWLNPDETIAASNWENLTVFSDWEDAYDNRIGQLILDPAYRDAVVRIVGDEFDDTDDIYLDLQFTGWNVGCCGGFSYLRAQAPSGPQPTGDYNGNGIVDAADYVVWRKTLNQPAVPAGSGADGDADGTIDPGDYDFWSARFGDVVAGAGGGATSVPEPGTAGLLLFGLLTLRRTFHRASPPNPRA